ncbi:MAG: M23 family metallopeptidase [Patescibacteria group bacterium]
MQHSATGCYYPTGSSSLGNFAGWLASGCNGGTGYFPDEYHIGHDYETALGSSVYAVADGVVLLVSTNGWGGGNVALIVKHRLEGTSEYFLSFYGHVESTLQENDLVYAGEAIGSIGYWPSGNHLHFGVVSGEVIPNSPWGRMPCSDSPSTNSFVDPVAWLESESPYPNVGFFWENNEAVWHDQNHDKPSQFFREKHRLLSNIGHAHDNGGGYFVHDWSGITLQDFYGDNTGFYDGHTAIMLNSAGTEAFLLKEGFRDFYMNLSDKTGGQYFGPTDLGAPTSDEEFNELDGNTYQYFDHGYMKYVPSYYSNTPGVVEVWLGSTKIASNTALMTIAGIGGSGGSGNGTGAVSIYQWTIPSSGVENIPYDFTVKLKNLESEYSLYICGVI